MKKERKEELLNRFPSVSEELKDAMLCREKKHCAANFVIFLTNGNELFARCFHRFYNRDIVERQRYVFAKDGCCRYGSEDGKSWTIRTEFREPVFCSAYYGYCFDNSYTLLNTEAVKRSCMRYSCFEMYKGSLLMEYLRFYVRHPNVEYLMKSGYGGVIGETEVGYYWSVRKKLDAYHRINWKSNNLLKMLGLNRDDFKVLKGSEHLYEPYREWKEKYPKYKPSELLALSKVFNWNFGEAETFLLITGVRLPRLAEYLEGQGIMPRDYRDYLNQCRTLQYDLHDTAICMPRDFEKMHTRLSQLIEYRESEEQKRLFKTNYSARKSLEFSSGEFLVRRPKSIVEIIEEGAALEHCVGGYAERHARGELTIMFLREKSKPDEPFYTIEVSSKLKIVQCRGYRNNNADNPKPKSVEDFEEKYQEYLDALIEQKARENDSTRIKVRAGGRKPRGNGQIHQGIESQLQNNHGCTACTAIAV